MDGGRQVVEVDENDWVTQLDREQLAKDILIAFCRKGEDFIHPEHTTRKAVSIADALIKQLNKE